MIQEPKPVSGASAASNWLSQLLSWVKGWRVLSIEGYRIEQTTEGRNFKKSSLPFPLTLTAANGLNYRGMWLRDGLQGKAFEPGDLIYLDSNNGDLDGRTFGTNSGFIRIEGSVGGNAVTFRGKDFFGNLISTGDQMLVGFNWILICTKKVTQTDNITLEYQNPSSGTWTPPVVVGTDSFSTFCIGGVGFLAYSTS